MRLRFENLMAAPLADQDTSGSEIWEQELELNPGSIIEVLAPSGKGKSTFVQILYGNRKDYTGEVFLDGKNIKEYNGDRLAELRQNKVSIVFQELLLFPELTGWENLLIKSNLTHYYDKEKIQKMSAQLNVQDILDRKCGQMSFGERQRMAIIRSLLQPFEWLLLDEPYSHLDFELSKKASALMYDECQKRNAGLLITSLNGDDFIEYDRKIIL